jgi:formylglycine-generating enzyme required for sulfatase activity
MSDERDLLEELGFVRLAGGPVQLGTSEPLPCRLEGHRRNETPVREVAVAPFWIARHCVTNAQYKRAVPCYHRPVTAPGPDQPATNVTYLNALTYAAWLSQEYGLEFTLPTEAQWVFAAAPYGVAFPWGSRPDRDQAHTRGSRVTGPLSVYDQRYPASWSGLLHISGNVSQIMLGLYGTAGHDGAATDGQYCLVKGGNWLLCKESAGVQRRGLLDAAGRSLGVGIRLVANLD